LKEPVAGPEAGKRGLVDLILTFRDGRSWAVEIKRGLSPVLNAGFFTALDDLKPDKAFVVYGGSERYRLKPEVEAISLLDLQRELLGEREQTP
jgi:hypothetical protein